MLKEYFKDKQPEIRHKCLLEVRDYSVIHALKMEIHKDLIIPYWDLRTILNC